MATATRPSFTGHGMFSGTGFLTKEGTPAVIDHGAGSRRNQIASAKDRQLSAWERPFPVEPKTADGSEVKMKLTHTLLIALLLAPPAAVATDDPAAISAARKAPPRRGGGGEMDGGILGREVRLVPQRDAAERRGGAARRAQLGTTRQFQDRRRSGTGTAIAAPTGATAIATSGSRRWPGCTPSLGTPNSIARWIDWIGIIAKAQAPDGYLSTNIQLDPRRSGGKTSSTTPLYNMGHLITAACAHQRATGKDSFLNVARKAADHLHARVCAASAGAGAHGFQPLADDGAGGLVPRDGRAQVSGTGRHVHHHARLGAGHAGARPRTDGIWRHRPDAGSRAVARGNAGGRPCGHRHLSVVRRGRPLHGDRRARVIVGAGTHLAERGTAAHLHHRRRTAHCPTASPRAATACTRRSAPTISCPTAPPTTKPAPTSATRCGTGGCSRSPATPNMPT